MAELRASAEYLLPRDLLIAIAPCDEPIRNQPLVATHRNDRCGSLLYPLNDLEGMPAILVRPRENTDLALAVRSCRYTRAEFRCRQGTVEPPVIGERGRCRGQSSGNRVVSAATKNAVRIAFATDVRVSGAGKASQRDEERPGERPSTDRPDSLDPVPASGLFRAQDVRLGLLHDQWQMATCAREPGTVP